MKEKNWTSKTWFPKPLFICASPASLYMISTHGCSACRGTTEPTIITGSRQWLCQNHIKQHNFSKQKKIKRKIWQKWSQKRNHSSSNLRTYTVGVFDTLATTITSPPTRGQLAIDTVRVSNTQTVKVRKSDECSSKSEWLSSDTRSLSLHPSSKLKINFLTTQINFQNNASASKQVSWETNQPTSDDFKSSFHFSKNLDVFQFLTNSFEIYFSTSMWDLSYFGYWGNHQCKCMF